MSLESVINAVGHRRLETGGNHWCFYLVVGEEESVGLDMTPPYTTPGTSVSVPGGSKGILLISHLACWSSAEATRDVRLDVRSGLKVADFVNLLRNKSHQYEFNDPGQGCWLWTDDQLKLFQQAGFMTNAGQIAEARASILTQYPDEIQYPLVVGGYYQ